MLDLTEIEKTLYARLSPVVKVLADSGIPFATLPCAASQYGEEELNGIVDIFIPTTIGRMPAESGGVQEVDVQILVRISLRNRYSDNLDCEQAVVEWVLKNAIALLFGFRLPKSKNAIFFLGHRLFKPDGSRWEVEARFQYTALIPNVSDLTGLPIPLVTLIDVFDTRRPPQILAEVSK